MNSKKKTMKHSTAGQVEPRVNFRCPPPKHLHQRLLLLASSLPQTRASQNPCCFPQDSWVCSDRRHPRKAGRRIKKSSQWSEDLRYLTSYLISQMLPPYDMYVFVNQS